MNHHTRILLAALLAVFCHTAAAQVPQIINYQGRINVGASPFTGTGQFRFALVNGDGTASFWSNDGTSTAGSQPTAAVSLPVANGLYVVPLGDTAIPNMQGVPASVFANNDVRLRVWFNDGTNGSQLLSPDQRITSVGYAMVAGTVPDGSITTAKLAPSIQVPGALPWHAIDGTSQQAESGNGYIANHSSEVVITLPPSPAFGDVVRISGAGAGGWRLSQNAGQQVQGVGFLGKDPTHWTPGMALRFDRIASSADGSILLGSPLFGGSTYVSSDSGVTWVSRPIGSGGGGACSADGQKLVVAIGAVHTSNNSGLTWDNRGLSGMSDVASSADGSKLVAVGAGIYTSDDSGATWTQRSTTTGFRSVASSSDGSKLFAVVYNGQIHISSDSGLTWTPVESVRQWQDVSCSSDGARLVASVFNTGVFTSDDSGLNWTQKPLSVTGNNAAWREVAISSDGRRMFAVRSANISTPCIHFSNDAGATWAATGPAILEQMGIACSADGSRIVTSGWTGSGYAINRSAPNSDVPASTTNGESGFLKGYNDSAVELQHVGEGKWLRLSGSGSMVAY